MTMSATRRLVPAALLCLGAAATAVGQAKPVRKAPAPPAAAPADLKVSVADVVDRRRSSDFPPAHLDIRLKLEGADASAIQSARARVLKAEDDTGQDVLAKAGAGDQDRWQDARESEPPSPQLSLSSPSRKAKTLAVLEGTVEAYLPSRDPSAIVKVDKIAARKDKPAVVMPALAKEKIRLQVLSKEGLEKERKDAEARKKAEAARKKTGKAGLEQMAEAMADAFGSVFERLFTMVGEHDLVLKVDDPGKKVFSLGLVGPDGAPVQTYGTTEIENYRILRLLEPMPEGAALQVRLKTAKTFAEVPFKLADVQLP
jgi:hypothetical protein